MEVFYKKNNLLTQPMAMKIKVCGMRDTDNIRAVAKLDIDMMGFVFIPDSPRYVQMISSHAGIIPDYSEQKLAEGMQTNRSDEVCHRIKRVGVFANDMPQNIVTRVYNYDLDYVQLNGSESPIMIDNLLRTICPDIRPTLQIIKKIEINGIEDLEVCEAYKEVVDLFLFDIKREASEQATLEKINAILSAYNGSIPFLLSGGIGFFNASLLQSLHHPQLQGINVNEEFETQPGVKDVEKLRHFVEQVKKSS